MTFKDELLIISDTPMFSTPKGIAVFEPTLREIEHLAALFPQITWIGSYWGSDPPANVRLPTGSNIKLIAWSKRGGAGMGNKLKNLVAIPRLVWKLWTPIKKARLIHTRGPALPAWIAVLLSFLLRGNRVYWHKYAGNWVQKNPPLGYGLQIATLKRARQSWVTVNGHWPHQPDHVLGFENPCLSEAELVAAREQAAQKHWDGPINLLFAGRLETAKGVSHLLDALAQLDHLDGLGRITLVGDGPKRAQFEAMAQNLKTDIRFCGYVSRTELNQHYADAHLFLLPSTAAEGFPKVLAEAAAYGCVPITSSVSSIGQYLKNGENAWILDPETLSPTQLATYIQSAIQDRTTLKRMSNQVQDLAQQHTYARFVQRITTLLQNAPPKS